MSRQPHDRPNPDRKAPDRQHWNHIAFIAALCERHLINFCLYSETADRPEDGSMYRRILNKVWEYLAGQLTSEKNLEKALLHLEAITPQPDEQDNYGIYPATDACLLLTSALQMILDPSIDDSDTAAKLSRSTVMQFISVVQDREFDPENDTHELYQQEQEFQLWIVEELEDNKAPRAELIKTLRKSLNALSYSNLGITLSE